MLSWTRWLCSPAVHQLQILAEQHDALAPGQFAQALHHVLNRSQRAGGEDLGALVVAVGGVDAVVRLQRSETADTDASQRVVLHVVDGGVQDLLVAGELLQRAHAGAGADDAHQVARLHLAVHVFLKRLADARDAVEREAEIVDHQSDGAADLFRPGGHRRWRRRRLL